jgi:hypothetical protein
VALQLHIGETVKLAAVYRVQALPKNNHKQENPKLHTGPKLKIYLKTKFSIGIKSCFLELRLSKN